MSHNDSKDSPSTLESMSGTQPSVCFDNDTYQSIFDHMLNGMAYCKMLYEDGCPCDYVYLFTNSAFGSLTGLRNVCGRRVSEVIPGIRESAPQLFEIFGRIAQGGGSEKFEIYIDALAMWFSIAAYSPQPGHFVAVFDVISERKLTEEILRASEERYLDVFDNTSDLIQCVALDGSFIYTNRAWRETLGYSQHEVESLSLFDVLHSDSVLCCQDRFQRLLTGESLTCISFMFVKKTGETVHLTGDCGSIIKDGSVISTRGIFKNITDTVAAEAALKISEARYQALYENAPDIFTTINSAGEILSINRAGASMLGYEVSELVGESASKVIHPEDQRDVFTYVRNQFVAPNPDQGIEYRKIRKDGSIFWVHQRVTLDPDIKESRLLIVCRDVTERRNLEEQLTYQATHDTLTNLINRREFERRLQRIVSSSAVPGDEHALCFLDLDEFKVINDTCGHAAGDELLRQVAALLQGQMRSRDTLARLGGDEFAVLMEYCSMDRAVRLAEKIRVTVQDFQFLWRAQQFSIGVSLGVLPVQHSLSVNDAIARADSACYTAKKQGGNRIYVSHPNDHLISG